jgi:hypothetical protein
MTNTKTLTSTQLERATVILKGAAASFIEKFAKKNGTHPTEEVVQGFCSKVKDKIVASILKSANNQSLEDREDRAQMVEEVANKCNLKFLHRRESDCHEEILDIHRSGKNSDHVVSEVSYHNATLGGETLAYQYRLDDQNNLFMVYSTAFCRPDENFDPLIGKEESIRKFLAGNVMEVPVTHERLGEVKMLQLVNAYKRHENINLEILKKASKTQ